MVCKEDSIGCTNQIRDRSPFCSRTGPAKMTFGIFWATKLAILPTQYFLQIEGSGPSNVYVCFLPVYMKL